MTKYFGFHSARDWPFDEDPEPLDGSSKKMDPSSIEITIDNAILEDDMGRKNRRKKFGFADRDVSHRSEFDELIGREIVTSHNFLGISKYCTSYTPRQKAVSPENVVSTSKGFMEAVHSDAWGTALIPVDDPKEIVVTSEDVDNIRLIDNFPKVPATLWSPWIKLCQHFCAVGINRTTGPVLEVSALFCRKIDDMTQWRILIPLQIVSGAAVNADLSKTRDLVTGETFDSFPPPGWVHAGSTHSHNTMGAFFSSTDDNSELPVPGMHIVVGQISSTADKKYEAKASIVLRRNRKSVPLGDVVDISQLLDLPFHVDVLEMVKERTYDATLYGPRGDTAVYNVDRGESDYSYCESYLLPNDTPVTPMQRPTPAISKIETAEDSREPEYKSIWITY